MSVTILISLCVLASAFFYSMLFFVKFPLEPIDLLGKNQKIIKKIKRKIAYNRKRSKNDGGSLKIGLKMDGQPLYIDFRDVQHFGVFASSGGGKTNLLLNIVMEIAKSYPNSLVDVFSTPKGAIFKRFEYLKGKKTKVNLDENLWHKRLLEIVSEMKEQERKIAEAINFDSSIVDIKSYNEVFRETPLPHHFIVIDEGRAILEPKGEGGKEKTSKELLVDIVSLGRSSGFHLILATQHLSRKLLSSDFFANLKSRIVLQMTSEELSKAAIESKDAVRLNPKKGEAIFRFSGENTKFKNLLVTPKVLDRFLKKLNQ